METIWIWLGNVYLKHRHASFISRPIDLFFYIRCSFSFFLSFSFSPSLSLSLTLFLSLIQTHKHTNFNTHKHSAALFSALLLARARYYTFIAVHNPPVAAHSTLFRSLRPFIHHTRVHTHVQIYVTGIARTLAHD